MRTRVGSNRDDAGVGDGPPVAVRTAEPPLDLGPVPVVLLVLPGHDPPREIPQEGEALPGKNVAEVIRPAAQRRICRICARKGDRLSDGRRSPNPGI